MAVKFNPETGEYTQDGVVVRSPIDTVINPQNPNRNAPNKYGNTMHTFINPKVGIKQVFGQAPGSKNYWANGIELTPSQVTEWVTSNDPAAFMATVKAGAKSQPTTMEVPGKTEKESLSSKPDRKNKGTSSSMPMKKDSWVMDLQKTINAETGANLVEDGKLGPKTKAAYKVYMDKINDSKNSAQSAQNTQLPTEGLAATVAPKEVGFLEGLSQFWERLFQDDRTPEQKAAEQQAVVDKILNVTSDNTGLAAAQYGR